MGFIAATTSLLVLRSHARFHRAEPVSVGIVTCVGSEGQSGRGRDVRILSFRIASFRIEKCWYSKLDLERPP